MASGAERAMSFGAVADDYDRLRPGPPAEAVSWLVPQGCQTAVDLGAGTGLLSRALAGPVPRVIAVEPDPRMRAVLRARSPGVRVLAGTAEAIPLPDASADGVFVSSAWHWMDPDRAVPEIARVLRDGGRFGVIWTSRDGGSGWLRALDPGRDAASEDACGAARSGHSEVTLPAGAPFGSVTTAFFGFSRPMSIDSIVDMLATYSRLITASPQERAAELARARARLRERFPGAGEVDVPMRSWCWRADRAARVSGTGAAGPSRA
jgi:SAM-dependent methyltransferase